MGHTHPSTLEKIFALNLDNNVYNISVVAQESGITQPTLRKWEERYGYPSPVRLPNGERVYTPNDLKVLKQVKHFIDLGVRPSKIFADKDKYLKLTEPSSVPANQDPRVEELCTFIISNQLDECLTRLEELFFSLSIRDFVEEICSPLCTFIGEAWENQVISINTEHIIAEQLQRILTISIRVQRPNTPTVILTTLSNENHTIGLKMANAIFTDAGFRTLYAGSSLPITEIISCCNLHDPSILALSITANAPAKTTTAQIQELRKSLPTSIELWLGGPGCGQLKKVPKNTLVFTKAEGIYSESRRFFSKET